MNLRVYISHRISSTDPRQTALRCERAVKFAAKLKTEFDKSYKKYGVGEFVKLDVYVPGGATETFVSRAYKSGHLSVDEILDVDCQIISDCDAVILFDPEFATKGCEVFSHGCLAEWDHAVTIKKPIYVVVCDDCHCVGNAAAFLAGVASECLRGTWIKQVPVQTITVGGTSGSKIPRTA